MGVAKWSCWTVEEHHARRRQATHRVECADDRSDHVLEQTACDPLIRICSSSSDGGDSVTLAPFREQAEQFELHDLTLDLSRCVSTCRSVICCSLTTSRMASSRSDSLLEVSAQLQRSAQGQH